VTLLGAERQPLPAWEQGAALLDWGFKQPRDASVGRLVKPGEAKRVATTPTPRGSAPASGLAAGGPTSVSWWGLAAGLAWMALVGAALLAVSRWRARRRA
jgi:hypothetical protein